MKFTKYSDIENSYRENYINKIIEQGYLNNQYVVQSKLDGANFSFICDELDIRVASRTQLVDGQFFNCNSVIDKYGSEVLQLFDLINEDKPIEQIQLYGELIGDGINNRVKYCKGREFIAFDLLITYKDPVIKNIKNVYLNYDKFKYYLKQTNLLLAPEHFIGNLKETLDYCTDNIVFNTLIPKILDNDYKELEINYEEGYVIKPVEYLQLNAGDRVIIKCKSPNFKEKGNKGKAPVKIVELTEEENRLLDKLTEYITESRIYSVVSKLGKVTSNDFGKVLGLYNKDVIEEFSKDNDTNLITKKVSRQLNKKCADCIRSVWTKLL